MLKILIIDKLERFFLLVFLSFDSFVLLEKYFKVPETNAKNPIRINNKNRTFVKMFTENTSVETPNRIKPNPMNILV